jgi:hypothetical protein
MDLIASGGLDPMRERLERPHRAHGGYFVADDG